MKDSISKIELAIVRSQLAGFIVFEIAFFIAYWLGMSFSQKIAAPFWFPDSVLLCALLISQPRSWWMYIAGIIPIRLFFFVPPDTPLWAMFGFLINDWLKGLLSAWLLRPVSRPAVWLESFREYLWYFLIAVLLGPALSASAAAPLQGYIADSFWTAWGHWFLGNALTSLMLTPVLVGLLIGIRNYTRLSLKQYVRALALVAGFAFVGYLIFDRGWASEGYPPFVWYLPVPMLLWAAVGFGPVGASSGLTLMSMVAIFATTGNRGPFRVQPADAGLVSLQLFLFFVSVPIMFLSVLSRQQHKTDASLRESEQRFRSLVDTAPVMVWMCGVDAQCTFLNKPWLDFTGTPLEKQLGMGWLESVHPDDRGKCENVCRSAFETKQSFVFEYRIRRNDGNYRWILDHGVPRFESDGIFVGFIGTCIDITGRKEAEVRLRQLSSQLIHAQETERFRIGQELHDDLSQRAAVLALRLSDLSRNHHANPPLKREFDRMREQVVELCKDMARVSHQLHPVTLTRLGLAVALRSLCEQVTDDQRSVLFRCDGELPPIEDRLSIALYRIAQEALRNALTHSGASCIDVELRATETDISLSIRDTGRGFDVASTAADGLGLSGMIERMKNAEGDLTILSRPGNGTAVIATAPLLPSQRSV
jgi:PAS domain S-box-containing protein